MIVSLCSTPHFQSVIGIAAARVMPKLLAFCTTVRQQLSIEILVEETRIAVEARRGVEME
jgi:hypothetical protein